MCVCVCMCECVCVCVCVCVYVCVYLCVKHSQLKFTLYLNSMYNFNTYMSMCPLNVNTN